MSGLPLYFHDSFGHPTGLVLAVLIGFAFGFVLERAGFGRASILAAQFYFTNMRVLKVMFSAIVTGLVGVTILAGLGLLDFTLVRVPETWLWPQLVGGLLLGMGFIVAGYCPGTGVVAMASGKWDGVAAIVGIMAGSVAFGFAFPALRGFYESSHLGVVRLPDLFGVPDALVVVGVLLMALGMFAGGELLERRFGKQKDAREVEPPRPRDPVHRRRVFAGLGAAALAGCATLLVSSGETVQASRAHGTISPVELAQRIVEDPDGLWLVDLRADADDRLPGAFAGDPGELPATRTLVLYAEDGAPALPASAAAYDGEVLVLAGGYRAFRADVLTAPELPAASSAADIADYRLRAALHARFTGARTVETPPLVVPKSVQRRELRRGSGC